MTGYGKGTASGGGRTLTIELKSVNNRYIEINSRLPKALSEFEDVLRREIQNVVKRGTIDVFFNYENNSQDNKAITIDEVLAREYVKAAERLASSHSLKNDLTSSVLIRMPDVMKIEFSKDDPELLKKMLETSVKEAVFALNEMRKTEGEGIKKSLLELIENISVNLKKVIARAPKVVTDYKLKLEQRIKELLQTVALDEAKLINEVAYFADKADINEEISRLSSHIEQFLSILDSSDQQGRKLDFLAQEMNREINTMGSKSNDIELTALVVAMKNELEKIKEQIRNVE